MKTRIEIQRHSMKHGLDKDDRALLSMSRSQMLSKARSSCATANFKVLLLAAESK